MGCYHQYKLLIAITSLAVVFSQGPASSRNTNLDIPSIVNELSRVPDTSRILANSRRGRQVFAASDRALERRESRRPIFGRNSEAVKQAALVAESQAAQLTASTGVATQDAFDANGAPLSEDVAEITIEAAERAPCVFDSQNTAPCTSKFREHSGRCANAEEGRRTWGMAGTPFIRILPNRYQDGVQEHRTTEFTSNTRVAASPRKISETVTDTARVLHRDFSTQVMQWGQFIAHEFTLIGELEEHLACCPDAVFRERNGKDAIPTDEDLDVIRQDIQELRGDICIAIENEQDTVFGGYVCMEHTRSTIAPNHDCSAGPRQQANLNTHLMDGSAVYGSSKEEADRLRSFRDGKMAVQTVNGHILPPADTSNCPASSSGRCPFLGGDIRINETPNLASIHTAFVVAHNEFATELRSINPHWDDERLYQETRRIISGIESSIHYNEFLPLILGRNIHRRWIANYGGFNSSVNPSVLNEMAGAAMRFGHSIVEGDYPTIDENGVTTINDLEEHFFDHDIVYELGAQAHLRGVMGAESRRVDRNIPNQMRNRLFAERRDIISLNLNRGRDHGFASYVDYRRHYGLSVPRNWANLRRTHERSVVDALQQVYTNVEDVELYIGGVTERPAPGALLGHTFANILGDGFQRLRDGDRLFYASEEGGLTRDQIKAIDDYSLAQLLCVGGNLETVSRNAFFHADSSRSQAVACSSLRRFDFSVWREDEGNPSCQWRPINISRCCRGTRTTVRECIGESQTCRCEGDSVITESCSCPPRDFRCFLRSLTCSFNRRG